MTLAVVALAVTAALFLAGYERDDGTNDAYITGRLHPVSARVAGSVAELLIDDNQHVQAGQVLARLDPRDFDVRNQIARAQIEQADALAMGARAQTRQAVAAMASAKANAEKTRLDLERAASLIGESPRGISQQDYDAAHAAHEVAQAAVEAAASQLAAAQASAAAAAAARSNGNANLSDAELARSYTDIKAPVAGRVGRRSVEAGARVAAGQTVLYIVSDDIWVVANFKEVQLRHLKAGDPVLVQVDALPDLRLNGRIESLSPATGAQFALLPPDNATGNFTKVVQRVPVKIRFEGDGFRQNLDRLVPGLSAVVTVPPSSALPATPPPTRVGMAP